MGKSVVSLAPKVWAITAPLRSYHVKMLILAFSNFHRVERSFLLVVSKFHLRHVSGQNRLNHVFCDGILFWETFLPGITFFRKISSQGKRIVVDRCNVTRLQRRVWLAVADDNKAPTSETELRFVPELRS